MDLQTFITETLCQIQQGVREAIARQEALGPKVSGAINPHFSKYDENLKNIVEKVTFDVAVTVSSTTEGEAKGGLEVLGMGVGAKGHIAKENSEVSRIQFSVPIVPPTTSIDLDASRAREERNNAAMRGMAQIY